MLLRIFSNQDDIFFLHILVLINSFVKSLHSTLFPIEGHCKTEWASGQGLALAVYRVQGDGQHCLGCLEERVGPGAAVGIAVRPIG